MADQFNDDLQQSEPPEITMLWNLFIAEKFEETVSEAEKYIANDANADRYNANKLIGLASFRLKKYQRSQDIFEALATQSNESDDWFNVLTSATLNKNILLSEKAMDEILKIYSTTQERKSVSLAQIYIYYMQALRDVKEYEKAFQQLSQLKKYYLQLKITDSTFLYMRGIPFLSHTMEAGKEILENYSKIDSEKLLDELQQGLDEEGEIYIKEFRSNLKYK